MTEINNNIPHIMPNISAGSVNKQADVVPQQLNDYSVAPEITSDTGILGKSQVLKPDSINSDIDFCLKQSPEFLSKCDRFFEQSLAEFAASGDEFAYEKACVLSKEFANEFV